MRTGGILMPISSLPSPYGIGTLGKEAYQFTDFLGKAGQTYWQILPICPTSYGDSPYQSFSSFAGNPYFIDLRILCEQGLLTQEECESFDWGGSEEYIDYGTMYVSRYRLLHLVQDRFFAKEPKDYADFVRAEEPWLADYALFMALKDAHGGKEWLKWEKPLRFREEKALDAARRKYEKDIAFYQMLQYLFRQQWNKLKAYANRKGILIIGDVPIYVALDSADVWANPKQFYLDQNLKPIEVAGCPPDAFSADGQLWGNPLFRWDVMKEDDYGWWTRRIEAMSNLYDVVRIDHFRGFDSYYAIPARHKTARKGKWKTGPGIDLFRTIEEKLGDLPIIVENLGFLTPSVEELLDNTGYPGMKILQFAFDPSGGSEYLPHNYPEHCVVYTGTHDNDTCIGWAEALDADTMKFAREYMNLTKKEGLHWGMMRTAWASVAETAIIPMQDVLGLGSEARINIPSTLGENWKWRMLPGQINGRLAKKLKRCMLLYGRLNNQK